MNIRTCTKCHLELPEQDNFYKRAYCDKYFAECKACYNKRKVPGHSRNYNLKWRYNISTEQYEEMLKNQNDVCAICYQPELKRKHLFVDHDHKTGKIRGLLCNRCNRSIGLLEESVEILTNAITYLKAFI